jgi:uncharacterized protein
MDYLLDLGGTLSELKRIDFVRLEREMAAIAAETKKYLLHQECDPAMSQIGMKYVQAMCNTVDALEDRELYERGVCFCMNGYNILNVDLRGNLYICHNTTDKTGTIHNSFFQVLKNVVAKDATAKNMEKCVDCPVITICNGGCKLVSKEARKEFYCAMQRAIGLPIINMVLELNQGQAA